MTGFGILAFITSFGLLVNETWGPLILQCAVALWMGYFICHALRVARYVADTSWPVWVMPLLCLASTLWSRDQAVTFRAAVENLMMLSFVVVIARKVPARDYIAILFLTLAVVAVWSIFDNNEVLDGISFQMRMAGIFGNKNTFSNASALLVLSATALVLDGAVRTWVRLLAVPFVFLGIGQNIQAGSVATSAALAVALAWAVALFSARLIDPRYRRAYVSYLALGGLLVAVVGAMTVLTFSDELLELVGKDKTLTGRTILWHAADNIIAGEPFSLGTGYAAFWVEEYAVAQSIAMAMGMPTPVGFSFHNLYYEMRIELGLLGVLGGALTIGAALWGVLRWVREDTSPRSIFFFSVFVFIVVIQTQGYDLFAPFNVFYAIFLAMMLYARRHSREVRVAKQHARQIDMMGAIA